MCSSLCPSASALPLLRRVTAQATYLRVWVVNNSARSRPSDKGGGGGVQVIQTLRQWGEGSRSPKKVFSALRVSVQSKNNGWPAPPGSLPWIRHRIKLRDGPCTLSAAELFIRSLDHLASLNKLGGSARRVRWTIRNVMGVGVGEVQNKYSCKGEIS